VLQILRALNFWGKLMMTISKLSLLALFSVTLLSVSLPGCSQVEYLLKRPAQGDDCRSCHASNGVAGAKDFSSIYANPKSHHPVGVSYPLGPAAFPNLNLPDGQGAHIAYFDRNGNGQPDIDEIQLFGTNIAMMVECASCHKPHGNAPVSGKARAEAYLRFDNGNSALCSTCHRQ